VVTLKGRVAADVSSGDELVLAELVLGGALGGWGPEQLVAAASCFVWQVRARGGRGDAAG
jgi:ATP-dependent RNA helicase DOB1